MIGEKLNGLCNELEEEKSHLGWEERCFTEKHRHMLTSVKLHPAGNAVIKPSVRG